MDNKELSNLEDLKVYAESAGGQYLRTTSKDVVMNTIEQLANGYKDKSHTELITLCANLSTNLSMYKLLTGIEDQIEAIKELLKEE